VPWLAVLAIGIALGLVTFAFVMMNHDLKEANSLIQHRLDTGQWSHIIQMQDHGPDIASISVALILFSGLWLVPTVIIRHYAADGRQGLLCLTAICFFAAFLVLCLAIGSFTILYSHTEIVTNALSWSSVSAAEIAASVLSVCAVLFVLGYRGA
jgi:hypothetical protein